MCSIVKYQQTKKNLMENTKLNEKEIIKLKTPKSYSTGWCYQPVLKGSRPPELARATWFPFSTGSC